MSDITCFIFDLDGTLVFNEEANFLAYEATFTHVGLTLTRDEYISYIGLGADDMLKEHCKNHGQAYSDELLKKIKSTKALEYAARLHLIEQNHATVGLLKALSPHYKTALATTAREQNARAVLDNFGLTKYFDCMVFAEQVQHKKPDPECYFAIAKHFNVKPEQCIIFEDSTVGIKAAEAFGAHICKVVR